MHNSRPLRTMNGALNGAISIVHHDTRRRSVRSRRMHCCTMPYIFRRVQPSMLQPSSVWDVWSSLNFYYFLLLFSFIDNTLHHQQAELPSSSSPSGRIWVSAACICNQVSGRVYTEKALRTLESALPDAAQYLEEQYNPLTLTAYKYIKKKVRYFKQSLADTRLQNSSTFRGVPR